MSDGYSHPGAELKAKYGMTGILTLPPDQGGIDVLLCDMDECYAPLGRAYFERIPVPMVYPNPHWIPTEDHFPRSHEAGGRRHPGNIRLAHRRCNGDDFGVGPGHRSKRQKARDEKQAWLLAHPGEARANEQVYASAEQRWMSSRLATSVKNLDALSSHVMTFDGKLLERGFWLYVWQIVSGPESVVYVGRTGDSSSPHASSPFVRVGSHLAAGRNAKGNSMYRLLQSSGIDATTCVFEMLAIGPIFGEQRDMVHHVPLRDEVGAQEAALAGLLASRGYRVLGTHPTPRVYDRGLFEHVRSIVDQRFPPRLAGGR